MNLVQHVKDTLVHLGPQSIITQTALRLALSRDGFRLHFGRDAISLVRNGQAMLIRPEDLSFVPVMAEMHEHFFKMLEPYESGGIATLDFTSPQRHKYIRTGIELIAPTIAEDDSMPEYTRRFEPKPGMVVFDVGAHAGLTTIELSRMVGPSGHVFAFEPDDRARSFLAENIHAYALENVTVSSAAIGEESGEAMFSMDGTQAAGLVDSIVYSRPEMRRRVQVLTLEGACGQVEAIPDYIKADIEGAELGMVRGSLEFLKSNPINMAFETHRLRDGTFTQDYMEPLLSSVGYIVEAAVLGFTKQNLLYATPPAKANVT